MATFCEFWRISPEQFWNLDLPEYQAMLRRMEKVKEEQDRRNRHRARSHR